MKSGSESAGAGSVRNGLAVAGLSLLVLAGVSPEASATILIDDFSNTTRTFPATLNADTGSLTGTPETGLTGVVGGSRNLEIGNATMDVDGFDNVSVSIFTNSPFSFFDYSSTTGTQAQARLQYGNAGTFPALNLNASAETDLRIDLLGFDGPAGQNLQIFGLVTSSTGGVAPIGPAIVGTPGASSVNLNLTGVPSAVRSDIDGIQLVFVAPKSGDFRVDRISLVPEPASAALLLGGLAPLALHRRRD